MMKMKASNAWDLSDLVVNLSKSDDYELAEEEKRPFINVVLTAASKTVTLGLQDGETAFVTNVGDTNAFTLKNVSGDTGTSVAKGKCAIVIASTTADGSTVAVLN